MKMYLENFSDADKINPHYMSAMHEDESVRTAIAIWEINDGSAAVALGRSAPPPPK